MKLTKNFKYYLALWGIAFVLFQLLSFVFYRGGELPSHFLVGYLAITFSFMVNAGCAFVAFGPENPKHPIYHLPMMGICIAGLAATLVIGGLVMLIPFVPAILGIILCGIIIIAEVVCLIMAYYLADKLTEKDNEVKSRTFFIKSLTIDAEALLKQAQPGAAKTICKKVYDAAKYSDPMTNEYVASIESQITEAFEAFSAAVDQDDAAKLEQEGNLLLSLMDKRNQKIKLLK